MSFLNHIRACNNFDPTDFSPFIVDGKIVGQIKQSFLQVLREWPDVFVVCDASVGLVPELDTFKVRTEAMNTVLEGLVKQGILSHLDGEPFSATPLTREQGLFLIDRAAAAHFGIRAFGQHLNGFVRGEDGIRLWIARRASDRRNYPGKLDNLVAGGLPYGVDMQENLYKECWEEASIDSKLAARARPVGAITYNAVVEQGVKQDTLYCYDLELPADFVPRCMDGEVETFFLWPVEKVMKIIRETGEFKLNCNLVAIDFMIRHGFIRPGDQDYLALILGLHQLLGHPFPPTGGGSVLDLNGPTA